MSLRIALFIAGVFCVTLSFASLPHTWGGHNIFLTPDSILNLGFTFLIGFIFSFFRTHKLNNFAYQVSLFIEKRIFIFTILFAGSLFAVVVWTNRAILHSFFNSGDEHSCYFLAECIRQGRFWADSHPLYQFFDVVHVGNKGGKWFSVYPPGWPVIWAAATQLKIGDLINPLLGTLATLLLFKSGRKVFGFNVALTGMAVAVTTPFYLMNHASYYSHTTCLVFISIFIFSFLKWRETKRTYWLILAAISFGYGLGTRYLTMTSVATPFIAYEFFVQIKDERKLRKAHLWFLGIVFIWIALNLAFNHLITGHLFEVPNHYYHNWERLGFKKNYTPYDAFIFIVTRLFYLMNWSSSALPLLYLGSLIFLWKRSTITQKLLQWCFVFLAAGYALYYSWGGNQYGPRYYFEAFPLMILSVSHMFQIIWKENSTATKNLIVGLFIAILAGNFYSLYKQTVYFEQVSYERKDLYETARKLIQDPSVVFIKGFFGDTLVMGEEDAVRNHPNLNTKIIYAHDLGDQNAELMNHYPNRAYYSGFYDREKKKALLSPIQTK